MMAARQRNASFNGRSVPERDACVPYRELSCIEPVSPLNGRKIDTTVAGPITAKLAATSNEMAGRDFAEQRLSWLAQ